MKLLWPRFSKTLIYKAPTKVHDNLFTDFSLLSDRERNHLGSLI